MPVVLTADSGPLGQPGQGTLTIGDAAALVAIQRWPTPRDLGGLTFACFSTDL